MYFLQPSDKMMLFRIDLRLCDKSPQTGASEARLMRAAFQHAQKHLLNALCKQSVLRIAALQQPLGHCALLACGYYFDTHLAAGTGYGILQRFHSEVTF